MKTMAPEGPASLSGKINIGKLILLLFTINYHSWRAGGFKNIFFDELFELQVTES